MNLIQDFEVLSIIKRGHFKLASGRHSQLYINKDKIYRSSAFSNTVAMLAVLCEDLDLPKRFVVTGPAVAGAILAAAVWSRLTSNLWKKDISFVYPEKIFDQMTFRRGYDKHLQGKQVLIIEDIITTGNSVIQTANAVKACEGNVFGVISIWNRTNWSSNAFRSLALINQAIPSWLPGDCPLCNQGKPLTDPKE